MFALITVFRKVYKKRYFRFVLLGKPKTKRVGCFKYILMALKYYQCKNCAITIKKDATPSASGCSVKTFHSWTKLGDVGDTNYSCRKGGTVVETKSTPSTSGCPQATSHSWSKL